MMKGHKILRVRAKVTLQMLILFKIQNIYHHFAGMNAEIFRKPTFGWSDKIVIKLIMFEDSIL